eukprot:RCo051895
MTEALPELPRSSLSMRNSVTGSQSNAATPSADVDGASPTTGYFSSGGSGSSGPPSPTSPSMGVRMRFSELECRRRSIYEKHAMLLQQEQASVLMEHMVREAMRRHVEAERRDRPQRERRQVRVQLWLTIIFAVSPVYTFTDAARQMQGMIILRKVLAVIWYRKWTNARAAKQRQALLEERAATMTRPTAKALARHKFFESFPRDSLEKLIRVMVPAHCSAGQNFILEGDPSTGQGMWIIDSGSAEVLVKKPPADGEPLNKRRCRANCSHRAVPYRGYRVAPPAAALLHGGTRTGRHHGAAFDAAEHLLRAQAAEHVHSLRCDTIPNALHHAILGVEG